MVCAMVRPIASVSPPDPAPIFSIIGPEGSHPAAIAELPTISEAANAIFLMTFIGFMSSTPSIIVVNRYRQNSRYRALALLWL